MRAILVTYSSAALCVLALASGVSTGHAETVVLESHIGPRPPDAEYAVKAMSALFEEERYSLGPPVAERIEAKVSRPAATADGLSGIEEQVDEGFQSWLDADFLQAVRTLKLAVERFHANPAAAAVDQTQRSFVFRALVGLSLAYHRLNDPGQAMAAMQELVRSFPERQVERSKYGPEALELFRKARADLERTGKGQLEVRLTEPSGVIFINEQFVAVGQTDKLELPPGRYRVFTQHSMQSGRLRLVEIAAGTSQVVEVDWSLEKALRTEDHVGFEYQSEAERDALEGNHARQVLGELGATEAVVVAFTEQGGRRFVVGTVYAAGRERPLRAARLPLEPTVPGVESIRSLARFLAGAEAASGLEVLVAPAVRDIAPASRETTDRGREVSTLSWVTALGGAALVGTGAYLFSIDGDATCENPTVSRCKYLPYETTLPASVSLGVGVGLLGLAGWLYYSQDTEDPLLVTLRPTWGGAFLVLRVDHFLE